MKEGAFDTRLCVRVCGLCGCVYESGSGPTARLSVSFCASYLSTRTTLGQRVGGVGVGGIKCLGR